MKMKLKDALVLACKRDGRLALARIIEKDVKYVDGYATPYQHYCRRIKRD